MCQWLDAIRLEVYFDIISEVDARTSEKQKNVIRDFVLLLKS